MQEVELELVALNLDTEQYYALNSTARQFLSICEAARDFGEASASIAQHYQISPERAAVDLRALLDELQQRGLLRFSAVGIS